MIAPGYGRIKDFLSIQDDNNPLHNCVNRERSSAYNCRGVGIASRTGLLNVS